MALEEYRKRRDFARTPEPAGRHEGDEPEDGTGRFVVQKHAARRVHYDLRLELDGVLKSWAVTRGPSLDPADKRLAVHTEDHPLEYGDFEGIIPEGEYGAGTVMVWDRGTWAPESDPHEGYAKGVLKFRLAGERLKGGFALVRTKRREGRDWLLVKERDDQARDGVHLLEAESSVASGRRMDEIAARAERVWREGGLSPSRAKGARRAELPVSLAPMLATLVEEAPRGDLWLHEIKFDGYRLLARIDGGKCRLFTRNGHDWTPKFPAIASACARLPCRSAWLDGEAVALDDNGISRFGDLQRALSEGRDEGLAYQVFDLVHLDGWHLGPAPLEERKALLAQLVGHGVEGPLRYTDHLEGIGPQFLRQACAFALEGVMSKRRDRPYRPGRGRDWLKAKCVRTQEFVVAGWSPPAGARSGIGSLVIGTFDSKGEFRPAGRVGSGIGARESALLEARLAPLVRSLPFFPAPPEENKGVTWVEPALVAEVAFTEWTAEGRLRHPTYRGLRQDKEAREVVRETPLPGSRPEGEVEDALASFRLTHPDRLLYPAQGLTKRALASYYLEIAEWMLPHLTDRPLTLVRCPEGQGAECFYQRHPLPGLAEAVRRVPDGTDELIAVRDLAGLIGLVQIGALEIHTWGSKADDLERPDLIVFDLDPDEGLPWRRMIDAAREVRERLSREGLAAFVKLTGGKGLHVAAPLAPDAGWDRAKAFCKGIAEAMEADSPDRYTAALPKARRKGRIFVDYLRNQRGATFVAPYSTRARAGAPVAVPISWSEMEAGIRPDHFSVETLFRRLAALSADPWAGMADAARPLPQS